MELPRFLVCLAAVCVCLPWGRTAFAQAEYTITFDELDEGYTFRGTRQPYSDWGIEIRGTGAVNPSIPTVVQPAGGTHTPPNALINELGVGSEFGSYEEEIVIDLSFLAGYASVYVGLPGDVRDSVTAHIEGYRKVGDVPGPSVVSQDLYLGSSPLRPGAPWKLEIENEEDGFDFIRISYGRTGAREYIDTLVIREREDPGEPPIEDTTDPTITISEPQNFSDVSHRTFTVMGYVDEDTVLETVTATADGRTTELAFSGYAPRYYYVGFVTLDPSSGSRDLRVDAEDAFGNSSLKIFNVHFDYVEEPPPPEPPPPDLNFVATGMEVTQIVQGWGQIGDTPQNINTGTSTVAGKKTLVRVYAEAQGTDVEIPGVQCQLHAFDGAEELPGSPMYAMDDVTLVPGENHLQQRPDPAKSFNFFLPPEWTVPGSILLRATVNAWNAIPERSGAFDVYNNISRDVVFHDTEHFCLFLYPIQLTEHGDLTPTWEEIAANVVFFRQAYPLVPEKLSITVHGTVVTDVNLDDSSGLSTLVGRLHRGLGFDGLEAYSLPCTNTVYIGLISPIHPDVGGITDSRFPVCISYAGDNQVFRSRTTHETAHALDMGHVEACLDPAGPYEPYPRYHDPEQNHVWYPEASIGEWAVEFDDSGYFEVLDPSVWRDIMSYCGDRWMSPYMHQWLFDLFTSAGDGGGELPPELGIRADVRYLRVSGTIHSDGKASLNPTWSVMLPAGSSDHTGSGPYRIQLLDLGGSVLFERRFKPAPLVDLESVALINELVPARSGVTTIRLSGDLPQPVLIGAGARPPGVVLESPNTAVTWPPRGSRSIVWRGGDPDGDAVFYTVSYSSDDGKDWEVLAADYRRTELSVRLEDLPGGENSCLVRVAASDGINQAEDVSLTAFTKIGQPPLVKILSPEPVHAFAYARPILFEAIATDREDGMLPPERLRWSSNRNGLFGEGMVVGYSKLNPGLHIITMEATDDDGMVASDEVAVYVEAPRGIKVNLPRSGQETCYRTDGTELRCANTAQDGEIRAGVEWPEPRFGPNGDGTMTDHLTGLVWPVVAGIPPLMICPDGAKTWDQALLSVECLNDVRYLGHRDWRLANVNELLSLIHSGAGKPGGWLESQGFENVAGSRYWTSTTRAGQTGSAWFVHFEAGAPGYRSKQDECLVWPVRSPLGLNHDPRYPAKVWKTGQRTSYAPGDDGAWQKGAFWPSPRFVDHGNGTVTDNLTGLMLLKDPSCFREGTWSQALLAVFDFNRQPERYPCLGYKAAYNDWRTPNFKELHSLIDFSRTALIRPGNDPFAVAHDGEYWSSTTYAVKADQAWTLRPSDGALVARNKEGDMFGVWPVRGGVSEVSDTSHLRVSIRDSVDPVPLGGTVAYTSQVVNFGPDRAREVVLENTLPRGTTLVSVTGDAGACQEGQDTLVCEIGELERGQTAEVVLEIKAPMEAGSVTATVRARCVSNDPNTTDNEASEATEVKEITETRFRRGYLNPDRTFDISDAVYMLGFLFLGRPESIPCRKAGDADDDGELNITDPIYLLNFLFLGGQPPAAPFSACGVDRTEDRLTCDSFPQCDV